MRRVRTPVQQSQSPSVAAERIERSTMDSVDTRRTRRTLIRSATVFGLVVGASWFGGSTADAATRPTRPVRATRGTSTSGTATPGQPGSASGTMVSGTTTTGQVVPSGSSASQSVPGGSGSGRQSVPGQSVPGTTSGTTTTGANVPGTGHARDGHPRHGHRSDGALHRDRRRGTKRRSGDLWTDDQRWQCRRHRHQHRHRRCRELGRPSSKSGARRSADTSRGNRTATMFKAPDRWRLPPISSLSASVLRRWPAARGAYHHPAMPRRRLPSSG